MSTCADCLDLRQCAAGVADVVTCVSRTEQNATTVRRLAELGLCRGATVTAGRPTPVVDGCSTWPMPTWCCALGP